MKNTNIFKQNSNSQLDDFDYSNSETMEIDHTEISNSTDTESEISNSEYDGICDYIELFSYLQTTESHQTIGTSFSHLTKESNKPQPHQAQVHFHHHHHHFFSIRSDIRYYNNGIRILPFHRSFNEEPIFKLDYHGEQIKILVKKNFLKGYSPTELKLLFFVKKQFDELTQEYSSKNITEIEINDLWSEPLKKAISVFINLLNKSKIEIFIKKDHFDFIKNELSRLLSECYAKCLIADNIEHIFIELAEQKPRNQLILQAMHLTLGHIITKYENTKTNLITNNKR